MPQDQAVPPQPESEVVASVAYVQGRRSHDVPLEDIKSYTCQDENLLWIGMSNPGTEMLQQVADDLGNRPKTRDEMITPHRQRGRAARREREWKYRVHIG